MFNKKDKKEKKKAAVDKVLMGAVIGGAIGSVIGASIAPQEGKKTRDDIAGAAGKAKKGGGRLLKKLKRFLERKKTKKENKARLRAANTKLPSVSATPHAPKAHANISEEEMKRQIPHES